MRGNWRIIWATFSVVLGIVLTIGLALDRQAAAISIEQTTSTSARLIAAHGDAAIAEARQLVSTVLPAVETGYPENSGAARAIHEQLQSLVRTSSRISSAWITDRNGVSVVDSWTFPAERTPSSNRDYFQRHLNGEESPIISGSEQGSISGRQRFTYSHAVRGANGELEAVIVVGLLTDALSTLYDELAETSGAASGLYKVRGDILAESTAAREVELKTIALGLSPASDIGGILHEELGSLHVVAWQASNEFPGVVALSAQDQSAALSAWRNRALSVAALGIAVVALIWFLAEAISRSQAEREEAERKDFAAREVSHRMKNSLQMIASFIRLRARQSKSAEAAEELRLVDVQLGALASVQELLVVGNEPGMVDVTMVLSKLCQRLEAAHAATFEKIFGRSAMVDSAMAGRIAILTNELITNALKHGNGAVRVAASATGSAYNVSVANGGSPLPKDFDIRSQKGFGLTAAVALSETIGATIAAQSGGPLGGAEFEFSVKIKESGTTAQLGDVVQGETAHESKRSSFVWGRKEGI